MRQFVLFHKVNCFVILLLALSPLGLYAQKEQMKLLTPNNAGWSFIENKGQLADENGHALPDIKYYGKFKGACIYVRENKISFVFTKPGNITSDKKSLSVNQEPVDPNSINTERMDLEIFAPDKAVKLIAEEKQTTISNYYYSHLTEAGITNVAQYKKLVFKNVYRQIDMVLMAENDGLTYEFMVHPGADVNDIQLHWNGLSKMKMNERGDINHIGALAYISESKPESYQDGKFVRSSFTMSGNQLGFHIDNYDQSKELLIDPHLLWATYFGGSNDDVFLSITTDKSNNVIGTGFTYSTGLATSGAFQTSSAGSIDIMLAKFSSSGSLSWSTYIGGSQDDEGYTVSADKSGNLYIGAEVNGNNLNLATSGAYKTKPTKTDALIAKFMPGGARTWSTYYGGGGSVDRPQSGCVDTAGNFYITGFTSSADGITTTGAYQHDTTGLDSISEVSWAFITKFTATGGLSWGTYLSGDNGAYGCCLDNYGNLYVTGYINHQRNKLTNSSSYQKKLLGKHSDAFLARFTTSGVFKWGTFYGDTGTDLGRAVCTDAAGNVYIAGSTNSPAGFATPDAFQKKIGAIGTTDIFLSKFNNAGSRIWSTYYGGAGDEDVFSINCDRYDNIYMGATTGSTSGISTPDAYQKSFGGSYIDDLLLKFTSSGRRSYATYFGGSATERAFGTSIDTSNAVYLAGFSSSTSGIATSGAYQTSNAGGNYDAFIARFYRPSFNDASTTSFISPKTNFCESTQELKVTIQNAGVSAFDSVRVAWSLNGKTQKSVSYKGKLKPDSIATVSLSNYLFKAGVDTLKIWTYLPNGIKDSFPYNDTLVIIDTVFALPQATVGKASSICFGDSIKIGASAVKVNTYKWTTKGSSFTSILSSPFVKPAKTSTYYLTESITKTGCQRSDSVIITVNPLPVVQIVKPGSICKGDSIYLGAASVSGYSYSWTSVPAGFSSTLANPHIKPDTTKTYKLVVANTATGCIGKDSSTIIVNPLPKANTGGAKTICAGNNVSIGAKTVSGNTYQWTSNPAGFKSITANPTVLPSKTTTYILTETIFATGCYKTDSAKITVDPLFKPGIIGDSVICARNVISYHATGSSGSKFLWHASGATVLGDSTLDSVRVYWPAGTYSLQLTETHATGCSSKTLKTIKVNTSPVAKLGSIPDSICANTPLSLSNSSTGAVLYYWSFGDGGHSSATNPTYTYTKAGVYKIVLAAINSGGCADTVSKYIKVLVSPDASWKGHLLSGKTFFFSVQDSSLPVAAYHWDMGDSSKASAYSFSHTFPTYAKSYTIKLKVSNSLGCSTTYDSTIIIGPSSIQRVMAEVIQLDVYPNPFHNIAVVDMVLKQASDVKIIIYDADGQENILLCDSKMPEGNHKMEISPEKLNLKTGIYFMKVFVDDKIVVKKLVYMKQ